jgi:hypothetical protein
MADKQVGPQRPNRVRQEASEDVLSEESGAREVQVTPQGDPTAAMQDRLNRSADAVVGMGTSSGSEEVVPVETVEAIPVYPVPPDSGSGGSSGGSGSSSGTGTSSDSSGGSGVDDSNPAGTSGGGSGGGKRPPQTVLSQSETDAAARVAERGLDTSFGREIPTTGDRSPEDLLSMGDQPQTPDPDESTGSANPRDMLIEGLSGAGGQPPGSGTALPGIELTGSRQQHAQALDIFGRSQNADPISAGIVDMRQGSDEVWIGSVTNQRTTSWGETVIHTRTFNENGSVASDTLIYPSDDGGVNRKIEVQYGPNGTWTETETDNEAGTTTVTHRTEDGGKLTRVTDRDGNVTSVTFTTKDGKTLKEVPPGSGNWQEETSGDGSSGGSGDEAGAEGDETAGGEEAAAGAGDDATNTETSGDRLTGPEGTGLSGTSEWARQQQMDYIGWKIGVQQGSDVNPTRAQAVEASGGRQLEIVDLSQPEPGGSTGRPQVSMEDLDPTGRFSDYAQPPPDQEADPQPFNDSRDLEQTGQLEEQSASNQFGPTDGAGRTLEEQVLGTEQSTTGAFGQRWVAEGINKFTVESNEMPVKGDAAAAAGPALPTIESVGADATSLTDDSPTYDDYSTDDDDEFGG